MCLRSFFYPFEQLNHNEEIIMKSLLKITLIVTFMLAGAISTAIAQRTIEMTGTDNMKFSVTSIEAEAGEQITIESILDTTMGVTVKETTNYGPYNAVIPEVTGSAAFTGRHRFFFDPEDPLKEGFIFR